MFTRMKNMRKNKNCISVVLLLILAMISVVGCYGGGGDGEDTCTQGDNMTNLQVDGVFDATALAPELRIIWDTGTEQGSLLPETYFEEVTLADGTNTIVSTVIDIFTYSNYQEITVIFSDLTSYLENENELSFSLMFPDRALFINCTHPGMQDQYLLNMKLNFDIDGNYLDTEFTQIINFGAI